MADGTVRWFDPSQGFGIIDSDGAVKIVFVHALALTRSGLKTLTAGQNVRFELEDHRDVAKSLILI